MQRSNFNTFLKVLFEIARRDDSYYLMWQLETVLMHMSFEGSGHPVLASLAKQPNLYLNQ